MPVEQRRVRIFSSGGTFEKVYDPVSERMSFDGTSAIPEILYAVGADHISMSLLDQVDSAEMDNAYRLGILRAICNCEEAGILLVHGTSTIIESAQFLAVAEVDKCVVLIGALRPARVQNKEAAFNVGFGLMAAAFLSKGVYIAMNGRVFMPHEVRKDLATGRFEPKM